MFSRGIRAIPNLPAFLPETRSIVRGRGRLARGVDSVAGWGMEATGERARRLAERRKLPYLALDEGFIRSLGPAATGCATMSLIVDPIGIYYDATRPSSLEQLLGGAGALDTGDAVAAIARIRAERISRTNAAPALGPGDLDTGLRPLVVVVDQVRDDRSVALGLGGEGQFHDMLDAALDEHPDAAVLVRLHPEVVAGRKEGHLAERARRLGITTLVHDVNPLSLVERAERVYTVTSQLGMEAMICGTPVTCFGMPFYAGWGATDDRAACARRTRRRSTLEIFAAAYLRYTRYVDPITGERVGLDRILDRLTVMKRANERNRGHSEGLSFARWTRPLVKPFFTGTASSIGFSDTAERAVREAARRQGRVCVWASREPDDLADRAQRSAVPVTRVDDGFLRSVGLGSDLVPSASLIFDRRGIYYDPNGLSELEEILEFEAFDAEVLTRAAALRERLLAAGVTKYNLGREAPFGFEPDPRTKVLVPGQVEDDASVRRGGGAIRTNLDLLREVRRNCPRALVVYKTHPDVEAGNRPGRVPDEEARRYCDVILRSASPDAAIASVDEVHTLTSLLGFEALLRGRRVVTYGGPFYAGWGLTEDRLRFPRRTRRLTIEQLVAGALMVYPSYRDPVTGLPCDVMTVVDRLAEGRRGTVHVSLRRRRAWHQLHRALRGLLHIARPAA